MKQNCKRLFALGAALTLSIGAFAGCGSSGGGKDGIDPNKSQLYVYNFAGGYGTEWLSDLARRYEEAKKDVSFEPGKTGIQIRPSNIKNSVTSADVKNGKEVVYFTEHVDLYGDLINNNAVEDITKAVTGGNPYESGKTLESKMHDDQKSYFSQTVNGETKYYAYPHYFTAFGITYDIDVFDEYGFYFAETPAITDEKDPLWLAGQFVNTNADAKKAAGPDGVSGTSDDGLPATYEDFFMLCEYIYTITGKTPLLWTGQYYSGYLGHLYNALVSEYEGYEQMRLNFTFDGMANDLGTVDASGNFVKDAEPIDITGSNGAELKRQAGKYYALKFMERLFSESYVKEAEDVLFSKTYSHFNAQDDFLMSSYRGESIAMLAEGTWWQSEASETFNRMGKIDAKWSKENRNFGWMPLPKASADKVGEKSVMYDIMYPLCYMKAGITDWRHDAALDFIQFANTDESLQRFNEITGVPKAVKYEITDMSNMNTYAKSLYQAVMNSDIVYPYAKNELFMNNQTGLSEKDGNCYFSSVNPNVTVNVTLHEKKNITAAQYFAGMYTFATEQKIWKDVVTRN